METNKQLKILETRNAIIVLRFWVQILKPENVMVIFIIIEVSCIDEVQTCTSHKTYTDLKNRSKDWKQWPNPPRIAFICHAVVTIYINDCYLGNFNLSNLFTERLVFIRNSFSIVLPCAINYVVYVFTLFEIGINHIQCQF